MIIILANLVWPALFLQNGLLSLRPILIGSLVEYLFIRQLTKFSIWKTILAVLTANGASTLLGFILIPLAGFVWELFPGILLYKFFNLGTFNPITWGATLLIAAAINALLETYVLAVIFKNPIGKRVFWWLFAANMASVGIAFYSLFAKFSDIL